MRSSIEHVAASAPSGPADAPVKIEVALPAVPQLGLVAGALIDTIVGAWDIRTRVHRLGDAAGVVADELADRTTPWSEVEVSVERDDLDVYVRLSAPVAATDEPALTSSTDATVSGTTQSHHVDIEHGHLLVVLQTPLR
jgi:hypothetical protein